MIRGFEIRSTADLIARGPFRLGNATIDPVCREAQWKGTTERIQPQTFKVLLLLAAQRGQVVTRDELVEACWGGRIIGDDVINRSILLLRQFAHRAGGFQIETVPKAGYRLVDQQHSVQAKPRRSIAIAGVGVVLIALLMAGIAKYRPYDRNAPTLTVAVVPFVGDRANEASKRLATQVEDSSVRTLTESGISVTMVVDDRVAASKADFVLSGTVTGTGKDGVASVRLNDPLRHAIVLSRRIAAQAADPAALPDQVGAQLATSLSSAAALLKLDRAQPSDAALVSNLLNTNQTDFDSQRTFELARRAAQGAPNSAIAQLSLAMATGMNLVETPAPERARVLAAGRAAAARAKQLAPNLGDTYIPWCMLHAEVRLAECETQLRKGLNADPHASSSGNILANLLRNVGRINEAVTVSTQTLARNAYAPGRISALVMIIEASGQSQNAEAQFKRGTRLWPDYDGLFMRRLAGITARGDLDAAVSIEKHDGVRGLPPHVPSAAPLAAAVRHRSLPQVRLLCPITADTLTAIRCMLALARLGDFDHSFKLAEGIYPRRTAPTIAEEEAIWLSNPDNLDTLYLTAAGAAPMRRDPRFFSLAERLGLVRYWRRNGLPDFCTRDHEALCARITGR